MQPIPITLLTAAVIIIAVSTIACTPASPGRQSSESDNARTAPKSTATLKPGEPAPTPKIGDPVPNRAGMPPAIYLPNPQGTLVPHEAINPPLTPPVLTSHLRQQIELHEATQEARRSAGQSDETSKIIWLEISLHSDDQLDKVAKYLQTKSIAIVGKEPAYRPYSPRIIAIAPVSMLREISELEEVLSIKAVLGSSNQRTQHKPSAQSLAEQNGVHTWRTVGITGEYIPNQELSTLGKRA